MSRTLSERRSPERWEALREFEQVSERMRRMLEQTFGGPGLPSQLADAGWSPLVDIEKTDDSYVVEAELPGNLENGVLSLRVPKAERAQRRQIEVKA